MRRITGNLAGLIAATAIAIGGSTSAQAALTHLELSATQGSLSAKATFDVTGNTLTILLENTSAVDVNEPGQVLTAFFWDPTANLTKESAVVGAGSVVLQDGTQIATAGSVVGGEYAYRSGLSGGAPAGAALGISSSGLGLFGPGDVFPGGNLQGPADPNGVQYGIVSSGYSSTDDNGGLTGNALIKSSVLFTFTFTGSYDLADVTNASFQYGTALDETNVPVPEPTTVIAGALLLLPFGASTIRFLRKNRAA